MSESRRERLLLVLVTCAWLLALCSLTFTSRCFHCTTFSSCLLLAACRFSLNSFPSIAAFHSFIFSLNFSAARNSNIARS